MRDGTLDTLIRLAQVKIDEARAMVAEKERAIANARAEIDRLTVERATEAAAAEADETGLANFPAFLAASREKEAAVNRSIGELGQELGVARARLQLAFQEMKRTEELKRRAAEARLAEAKRRESAELDEIGLARSRRASP
ncbi:MAG: flagellar FliJ family protein [Pseudomonadota bacterium]